MQSGWYKIMFSRAALALILLFGVTSYASAGVGSRTVEASGNGVTVQQAVDRALVNAITQVSGASIASRARSSLSVRTASEDGKQTSGSEKLFQETIEKKTKGIVKGYEILSQKRRQNSKLYNVKLSVTVATYKQSAQLQRLRMAVVPFRLSTALSKSKAGIRFEETFRRGLENYLTQTRRFAILDRSFVAEQDKELSLLRGKGIAQEEMARIGNKVGTDYLITGVIEKAYAFSKKIKMRTTGQVIKTPQIGGRITYRILDVASTQVKFASTEKLHLESGSLESLGDKLSVTVGQKILNAIFPIYVLSVNRKTVTLGQGGDAVKKGAIYSLISLGDEIFDPYTKESLGRSETVVGSVRVVNTQAKLSTGVILKMSIAMDTLMRDDFIVRPRKGPSAAAKSAKKMKSLDKEFDKEFDKDEKDAKW
ncbi:MAG: hypothetical protein ACKVIF_04280 [Rhodospirillales bacterium]|jgi:hypothetical protein